MRILLTGGTGFIGQHLAVALANQNGVELTLLVREGYALGEPLPPVLAAVRPHLNLVYADLRNWAQTRRAVREAAPEIAVHLAARGATDPFLPLDTALRHNLTGSLNVMRACFESGGDSVKRLIMARTPGERHGLNIYSASKAAVWPFAQFYAQTMGWPIIGGMIFQCYGLGQPPHTLISAALKVAVAGEDFPMTAGQQTRDFIYIADVVAGLQTAILAKELPAGKTLELGTGVATSLLEVVTQIYALVGRGGEPRPSTVPERAGERPQPVANLPHTQQWLAWQPLYPVAEGLREMVRIAGWPITNE